MPRAPRLLPAAALAKSRELTYPSVVVTAHVDTAGSLTIAEHQSTRLIGDWNRADRNLDLRGEQALDRLGISRIDPACGTVPHHLSPTSTSSSTQRR